MLDALLDAYVIRDATRGQFSRPLLGLATLAATFVLSLHTRGHFRVSVTMLNDLILEMYHFYSMACNFALTIGCI